MCVKNIYIYICVCVCVCVYLYTYLCAYILLHLARSVSSIGFVSVEDLDYFKIFLGVIIWPNMQVMVADSLVIASSENSL